MHVDEGRLGSHPREFLGGTAQRYTRRLNKLSTLYRGICKPDQPWTHRDSSPSASWALGLIVRTTGPDHINVSELPHLKGSQGEQCFCRWRILLNIVSSGSSHFVNNDKIPFFLITEEDFTACVFCSGFAFFFFLFYIPGIVASPSSPPSPSFPLSLSVLTSQSTSPLFLCRKEWVSREFQQNMVDQVAKRLSIPHPSIKTGKGDPVWRVGLQKPIKESDIAPVSAVRDLYKRTMLHDCNIYSKCLGTMQAP